MISPSPTLDNGSAAIPCLLWATAGAITAVISSTAVAYPAFLTQKDGVRYSSTRRTLHAVANVIFSLLSIGCFIKATGYGPVALAMPLQTGLSLLLNMIVQTILRMKRYTKEMTAGTLVLVCAVVILVDVGPTEQQLDPMTLLLTPMAMGWNIVCVLLCVGGALGIRTTEPGSHNQLLSYSLAISSSTVVGASVGKLMQEAEGSIVWVFVGVYLVVGVVNLYWGAMAAASTDISLLMPVKSSLTLGLNCATGLLVWQDWRVIEAWTSYIMVYLLVLLGVYTCATGIDFVTSFALQQHIKGAMLSRGVASSSFGRAVKNLIDIWAIAPMDTAQTLPAVRSVLEKGLRGGALTRDTLVLLCVRLFHSHGTHPSPLLMEWMSNDWPYFQMYIEHDPAFQEQLQALVMANAEREGRASGGGSGGLQLETRSSGGGGGGGGAERGGDDDDVNAFNVAIASEESLTIPLMS